MREGTRREIEQWWRDVFGVRDALWSNVTVLHPHGLLGDYVGWYVAWRDSGVHVSAPSDADANDVASLANEAPVSLQAVGFWHAFAQQRGLEVIGPGVHRYLDDDPGSADGVQVVAPDSLLALRDEVSDDDWWECGFDESLDEPGVVAFATEGGGAVPRRAGADSASSSDARPRRTQSATTATRAGAAATPTSRRRGPRSGSASRATRRSSQSGR